MNFTIWQNAGKPVTAYQIFEFFHSDPDQAAVTRLVAYFHSQPLSTNSSQSASKDRSEGKLHPH
jgi:hypothetical protein